MASPRQLDFTSSGGVDDSEDTPSRRKSLRITAVKYAVPDAEESDDEAKRTKKTKKKKKSVNNRIWDEEDELTVLKGLVDYRAKSGSKIDWGSFYRFIGASIGAKFSKEQVLRKIRKLKRRFLTHSEKINHGHDPHFTKSSDSEAFGFSMMLWGQNESQLGHSGMDEEMLKAHEDDYGAKENGTAHQNVEEVLKEQVAVATVETLNANGKSHHDCGTENGTAQNGEEILKEQVEVTNVEPLNHNGKSQTDNGTENRIARKESHDNDDDELCAVKDAFETMMSQGLSDYQKRVQLEKLMNLGGSKRRELSDEWKALCVEERRLNVKRLRFSAKLAEAANDS